MRIITRLLKSATAMLIVAFTASAQNGEPSREPVLRIETGMHTATIMRIGVDRQNRFLVTASADKTIRVWELSTGRLLRIIRPPIGDGNEGKLFAVAISPDGETIAAGGWTGYEWQKQHSIYLFERASGRLLRRLSGLPNVVQHLAYSPDNRFLAATLFGGNGVRVFDARSGALIGEDKDYGSDSYGADFDAAGRLVTTCFDGFIRLYQLTSNASKASALRLIAKRQAEGGTRPFAISFAPDSSRIAVGFDGSTKVAVLSSRDLSLLYAPDTSGVTDGDLSKVAWSIDGRTLYAGGSYDSGGGSNSPIRAWTNEGRGNYTDIQASANTILHIVALNAGGVAYGAYDPAFGVIDANNRRTLFIDASIADYRALLQNFLVSADGATVSFGYEVFGKSPARFNSAARTLETATSNAPTRSTNLRPPIIEAENLSVTDWRNTYAPKLNGQSLKLDQYEVSRSLAISSDRSGFLLGTEFSLRLFNRDGTQRWQAATPGVAWAVNISGDNRLAVAGFGDGTIRWYRTSDGKAVLNFFPHKDRKRWVLWTPSGYYDASPGGEDLIGWHINNGRDQAADFYPAGQFRGTFYRPDIVAKVLTLGDESLAVRLANEEAGRKAQASNVAQLLPPVVEIVSPQDSSNVNQTEISVRFRVRTPSGEAVTNIKILVDGRPIPTPRGLGLGGDASNDCLQKRGLGIGANDAGGICEARISVPEKDALLSVIAENRYAASVPATVSLKWRGNAAANIGGSDNNSFVIKPKLYVLAIGIGNYANPDYKLRYPAKDARDFAATLERQKGGLYRDVVVKVLTDEKASKDDVLDGLDWIRKETTSKDVAMILLAGHGVNDSNGDYYFLPYNADLEKLFRTGVPFSDIRRAVSALAGKTLFFVDTCHSGNILGTTRRALTDINGMVNELSSAENGAVVFAASTGKQYSLEKTEWQNGAFTKAVVEGFNGRADFNNRGRITINMLDLYISERVKELTGGQQTPTTAKPNTVPDFPVVLRQ